MTNDEKLTMARDALEYYERAPWSKPGDVNADNGRIARAALAKINATESAPAAPRPCTDPAACNAHGCCDPRGRCEEAALAQRAAGELPPLPEKWPDYSGADYSASQMNARYREGFAAGSALVEGIIYERDAARAQLAEWKDNAKETADAFAEYRATHLAARAVGGVHDGGDSNAKN